MSQMAAKALGIDQQGPGVGSQYADKVDGIPVVGIPAVWGNSWP